MRFGSPFSSGAFAGALIAGLLIGGSTFAASNGGKAKTPSVPPPAAADIGLRGALTAPVNVPATLAPPILSLPAPGASFIGLSKAGFATPPLITPLRAQGDPAPICRAECAKTHVTCASGEDTECDHRWVQCVSTCSVPTLR